MAQPGKHWVNLNCASVDDIAALPAVGHERAEALVQRRPINGWDDVRHIPGFSDTVIDGMRASGAKVGSEFEDCD